MAAVATVLPTSFQIVDGVINRVVHGWRERVSGSHHSTVLNACSATQGRF